MIIIARLLEKGDVFRISGQDYISLGLKGDIIFYRSTQGGVIHELGINSKQKILLVRDCLVGEIKNLHKYVTGGIINPSYEKKKTRPIKSITQYKQVNKKIRQADKLRLTTSSHF